MKSLKYNKIIILAYAMLVWSDTNIGNTTIANWIDATAKTVATQHDSQADPLLLSQTLINQLSANINSIAPKGTDQKQAAFNTAIQLLSSDFYSKYGNETDSQTVFNSLLSDIPNISTETKIKSMIDGGFSKSEIQTAVSSQKYNPTALNYNSNTNDTIQNFGFVSSSQMHDITFDQLASIGQGDITFINKLISATLPSQSEGFSYGFTPFWFNQDVQNQDTINTDDQEITQGKADSIWEAAYMKVFRFISQYGDLAQYSSPMKLNAITNLLEQALGNKATDIQKTQTIIAALQTSNNGTRLYTGKEIANALSSSDIDMTTLLDNANLLNELAVSVRLSFEKSKDPSKAVLDQVNKMLNLLSTIISPTDRYNIDYIVEKVLGTYSTPPSQTILAAVISGLISNNYFFERPSDLNGNLGLIIQTFRKNGTSLEDAVLFLTPYLSPQDQQPGSTNTPLPAFQLLTILQLAGYTKQDITNWINHFGSSIAPGTWGSFFPYNNSNVITSVAVGPYSIATYFYQSLINGYGSAPISGTDVYGRPFQYTYFISTDFPYNFS